MDVLCIGETMVMVAPVDAEPLRPGVTCLLTAGGAESNVATHLARLGHRAAWAGALGTDPLGDLVLEELGAAGVDVSAVLRDPARRTAVYLKNPTAAGTTVHYYRDGSAAAALTPAHARAWSDLAPAVVHVSGITAALSPGCAGLLRSLVTDRALGAATVSFDVNYRPRLWPDADEAASVLLDLASTSDVVFVGRDEAESLWGTPTADDVRALLPSVPHLVVKDGAAEATEHGPAGRTSVAAPVVDVVEAVGAGDAFAAGWLAGRTRDLDATGRLRLGHLVAAHVLGSPSDAAPLPHAEEIEDLLALDPRQWRLRPSAAVR